MGKRILIIDDEPHIIKVIKSRLEINDYEVITASDGEEGMEKVKTDSPDLIVLDMLMPKMDGYTFVRELKNTGKKIPVIVLTAKHEVEGTFIEGEVKECILKPFQPDDLLNKINKHLKA